MTLRLVALMSIVLLLSLGAFGLVMSHYQDQVLEEVARTASEVGRATLRTLESSDALVEIRFDGDVPMQGVNTFQTANTFQESDAGMISDRTVRMRTPGASGAILNQVVVIDHLSSEAMGSGIPGVGHLIAEAQLEALAPRGPGGFRRTHTRRWVDAPSGSVEGGAMRWMQTQVRSESGSCEEFGEIPADLCERLKQHSQKGIVPLGEDGTEIAPDVTPEVFDSVFFSSEKLHVDGDPTDGLIVLRIPTFRMREGDSGESSESVSNSYSFEFARTEDSTLKASSLEPGAAVALLDEEQNVMPAARLSEDVPIELPVPLAEYEELFASFRTRSLIAFLGVFLVGTVLTAGLAARFTRPIRNLDAGLHRISDGDLDVEVAVDGKDEMARLGRAFNEMTRRLRASRDQSRELVRREKLSALGGLAAGVAHDVRNPLHSIGLTLQHLNEAARPKDGAEQEEFDRSVEIIRGEVGRLDTLVTNFLRFARSERKERQPVDLAEVLRETRRLVQKEAEWRNVDLELNLNLAVPAISADGEAIRSAILNLVINSFDAMPDGGKLQLDLGVERDQVWVEVTDDGSGIPDEEQDRVFEFAYTTRETGSGLGLAMVHQQIVEEHSGRVELKSEQGKGTTVRLSLPIRPPEREEPSAGAEGIEA